MDQLDVEEVGRRRDRLHKGQASTRNLSRVSTHSAGLAGEKAFGQRFNLLVDTDDKIAGDGGVDFRTRYVTVDVKSVIDQPNHRPWILKREISNTHADVLVLAIVFWEERKVRLCGWEWDHVLASYPVRTFGKHEIENNVAYVDQLRPIDTLDHIIFPQSG